MPRKKKTYRNKNGTGTVYNLGGNRTRPWVAKYPISIERAPETKKGFRQVVETIGYYATKDEADIALIEYRNNKEEFIRKKKARQLTFKDVYNDYIKYKGLGPKDTWAYSKFNELHNIPFCEIELIHYQRIIDELGFLKGSLEKIKSFLKGMYAYAIPNKIIETDLSVYINLKKAECRNQSIHKPFTKEEINTLWNNLDKVKDIDTILIMIYLGYRPSELCKLKNSDINIDKLYITGGIKSEAGKTRVVPISNKIAPLILKRYNSNKEYFLNDLRYDHYTYDAYRVQIFLKVMDLMKMDHKPHDCRHTFTTLLSNADANPTSITKLVGHTNFKMTEDVYIHKNIDELRKAVDKI